MGNASSNGDSGLAGVVIVDKPLVLDQDTNEELEVEVTVNGDKVKIDTWADNNMDFSPREPNNVVAIPPPLRGTVFVSVFCVNADDEEERREVGKVCVPHTSLETFDQGVESGFTIWFGLLDSSLVPNSIYPKQYEAERCFANSVDLAKDPLKPKICFTFATIRPAVLNNPEQVESYQRTLIKKPVMQLLGYANEVIKSHTKNNKSLQKELRALHREFRSKETIFHSFVHVEKKTMEENKERMRVARERFIKRITEEFLSSVLNQWQTHKDFAKLHGWRSTRVLEEDSEVKKHWETFVDEQKTRNGTEIERLQTEVEVEKERAHEHVDSAVMKWVHGEDKGLMISCFYNWKRYMEIQEELQTRHEAVKIGVMKWIEGEDKGLQVLYFRHWWHYIQLERVHAIYGQKLQEAEKEWQNLMEEQNTRYGQDIERQMTATEIRREQAHEVTQMMLRKWSLGDDKGAASACLYEWRRYIDIMRELERRHETAKAVVMNFAEGDDRASKHLCFIHWVHYRKMEVEHRKRTDFESELEHLGEAQAKKLEEAESQAASAKAAIELAIRKWEFGTTTAIRMEAFSYWHTYTTKWVAIRQGQQCVKVQVMKWLEGERRGLQQAAFGSWKEMSKVIQATRSLEADFEKTKKEWDEFMKEENTIRGKELERALTDAEKWREQAHEVTAMMLKRWIMGDVRGMMATIMCEWKRYYDIQKDLVRRHEAVKCATLGFLKDKGKGIVKLCFSHWDAFHERERHHNNEQLAQEAMTGMKAELKAEHRLVMERAIYRWDETKISLIVFNKWKREWTQRCHGASSLKESSAMKRKHGDIMNRALAKWTENNPHLYLHAVLRALWQTVADARQARGHGRVLEARNQWRKMALNYTCKYVDSLEKRLEVVYLVHWKGLVNQEKRLRRADEEHHDLRKRLAVHCLATSQEADECLTISEKCGGLTSLLQGEMHTQGITLEALEHEVYLLESQMSSRRVDTKLFTTSTVVLAS